MKRSRYLALAVPVIGLGFGLMRAHGSAADARPATPETRQAVASARAEDEPVDQASPGPPLPDLAIGDMRVTMDPAAYCHSAGLGVGLRVDNLGDGVAGPFDVQVLDVTHRVVGLLGHESRVVWVDDYRYVGAGETTAAVDTLDEIQESREDNNSQTVLLPVPTNPATCTPAPIPMPTDGPTPTAADLQPHMAQIWTCPCWECPGHVPFIVGCVNNDEGPAARRFDNVAVFAHSREVLPQPDGLVGGGQACWSLPLDNVTLIVDAYDRVAETNEDNNRASWRPATYTPPPPCVGGDGGAAAGPPGPRRRGASGTRAPQCRVLG